jgi:hypothetical protein
VDDYATRKPESLPSQPLAIIGGNGHGDLAGAAATHAGAISAAR